MATLVPASYSPGALIPESQNTTVPWVTESIFEVSHNADGSQRDIFNVRDKVYGAKGDAVVLTDGAITIGTAVLTSASASFVPQDVGKSIHVYGAGDIAGDGDTLRTTILSRQSATQVTLATNATVTVSGKRVVYGTDNTALINSAITDASPVNGTVLVPGNGLKYLVNYGSPYGDLRFSGLKPAIKMKSNVTLLGVGRPQIIFPDPGNRPANSCCAIGTDTGGTESDFEIRGVVVNGLNTTRTTGGETGHQGIAFGPAQRFKVIDTEIKGVTGDAFNVSELGTDYPSYFDVVDNYFHDCTSNAIGMIGCKYFKITGNLLYNNLNVINGVGAGAEGIITGGGSNSEHGVIADNRLILWSDINVSGNDIAVVGNVIRAGTVSGTNMPCLGLAGTNLVVIGNTIDMTLDTSGLMYGIAIDTGTHSRINITGNTIIGHKARGVFTVTIASPAVFSKTAHGLAAGDPVVFTTTGALPTGLVVGTTYYVIAAGLTANAFEVSTTSGGAAVNTSGTQSGTHTLPGHPYGVFLNATITGVKVSDNMIYGCGKGTGGAAIIAASTVTEGSVTDNMIVGDDSVIEVGINTSGANMKISGNKLISQNIISDGADAVISDNHILGSTTHGAPITATGIRTLITGNRITNVTSGGSPGAEAINVNHTDVLIEGNYIRNLNANTLWIRVNYGPGIVRGNYLYDTGVGTIGTASGVVWRGNYGYVTENNGVALKQNGSTIAHGLAATPTKVILTPSVAKRLASATALDATNITISLHDDTGAAIVVNENVYWSAEV